MWLVCAPSQREPLSLSQSLIFLYIYYHLLFLCGNLGGAAVIALSGCHSPRTRERPIWVVSLDPAFELKRVELAQICPLLASPHRYITSRHTYIRLGSSYNHPVVAWSLATAQPASAEQHQSRRVNNTVVDLSRLHLLASGTNNTLNALSHNEALVGGVELLAPGARTEQNGELHLASCEFAVRFRFGDGSSRSGCILISSRCDELAIG